MVDGNVKANQPLSLYLGSVTVHGNVVSNGGGTADRFYNFPIKDNTIDGNLIIHGWTGGWWGAIANTVGGKVESPATRASCSHGWVARRNVPEPVRRHAWRRRRRERGAVGDSIRWTSSTSPAT